MYENSKKEQKSTGILYVVPRWMVWTVAAVVVLNGAIMGFIGGWGSGAVPDLRDHLAEAQEQRNQLVKGQLSALKKVIELEQALAYSQQLIILLMNNNTNLIAELDPLEEKAFNSAKSNLERVNTKYENWDAMLLRGATPEELGYGTNGNWEKAKIFNLDGTPKAERN